MPSSFEERRMLTILFADLSGFTSLSSKLDPEEVREAVNLCFEHLNKAIVSQGGTIHKYDGDLVMALFGLPVAHEDDPERALQASFEMLRMLPEINRALSARIGKPPDLGLHVGINSGTVVVGEIGSPEKREYTVMGDPVNLASRLKDLAKRGEIVVSEPVFRASRYLFDYETREPVAVKGIEEPVRVFRPLSRREKPDPKRGIQGLSSPLVAREKELGSLLEAVGRLQQGQGGSIFLLGEAGLGKTRLLEELRRYIGDHQTPVQILEGRCLTYSETVPYWPFLQVLSTIFGISDQDSKERVREKILDKTQEVFPNAWKDIAPYLGYLFSIRFEEALDEKVKYLDAKGLKTQILVSARKLLTTLSKTRPVLLVIDDYHWIDSESLVLLEFLFDFPKPYPMLLLALSRPEKDKERYKTKEQLKARLGRDFREILLEPLGPQASTQLVYNLLKMPGFPAGFKEMILAKAEGNPFYLEEVIRSLIESRILTFEEGIWHLSSEIDSVSIPDTVQAVIATRLDKLEKDVREVLQLAAVIGRSFHVPVLENLCGMASLILTLYLADLEEHEYISEHKREADLEYVFRHPLFQEVAYNSLLKKRRRELHRRAGETIEELYRDRLEDFTELLAYQYAQGDDSGKALTWLEKAGQKAQERYANDEAIDYYEQVISLLETGGEARAGELVAAHQALADIRRLKGEYGPALASYQAMQRLAGDDRIRRSSVRAKIAEVYYLQGRVKDAFQILDEAENDLAGATYEEKIEKTNVSLSRSDFYRGKGEYEKSKEVAETALGLLAEAGHEVYIPGEDPRITRLRARGFNIIGLVTMETGNYDQAKPFFQNNLELDERLGNKTGMFWDYNNLGLVARAKGDLKQAIGLFERSLVAAEAMGDVIGIGKVCNNLGLLHFLAGDFGKAVLLYERELKNSEESGEKLGSCIARSNVGLVWFEQDEFEKAKGFFIQSLAEAEEIGSKRSVAVASCCLGRTLAAIGELEEGERYLLRSVEVSREMGDKERLIEAYTALAELKIPSSNLETPPHPEAIDYAKKALQLADQLESPALRAGCFFTLAKVHAATGDFKRSETCYQKAIAMVIELNAQKYLADTYLDYARLIRRAAAKGVSLEGRAEDYFQRARDLYLELNLTHKLKDCQ